MKKIKKQAEKKQDQEKIDIKKINLWAKPLPSAPEEWRGHFVAYHPVTHKVLAHSPYLKIVMDKAYKVCDHPFFHRISKSPYMPS